MVPVAEKAGLGDVIAHGMLVMGFAGQALTKWFPRQHLREFKVRFVRMTRPGEELTVSGHINGEVERDGEKRWVGEVFVKNGDEVKLTGQFEVLKHD